MGILSYTYNAAKAALRGKGKVSPTIKSVKPSVPITKAEKVKSKLKILKQRTKGSQAKLDQNLFNLKEKTKKGRVYSGKELEQQEYFKYKKRENKMGGGMMGRRFGMKKGSKFPDLTGDGKVTFADILKGRGVINGKKKKKA